MSTPYDRYPILAKPPVQAILAISESRQFRSGSRRSSQLKLNQSNKNSRLGSAQTLNLQANFSSTNTTGNFTVGGVDLFGNTTSTAFNAGNMSGNTTYTFGDFVGDSDTTDFFRFSVGSLSSFNIALSGLSSDADIQLLNSSGGEIARSQASGATSEQISRSLNAGTYFVRVYRHGTANTSYSLRLQGAGNDVDPGASTSAASDFGNITRSNRTRTQSVGSTDPNDYYRFNISEISNFNLSLGSLSADADVQLLSSSGTVITGSARAGTTSETISTTLNAGTYYVRVYPHLSASTSYQLNISAAAIPDQAGNTLSSARNIIVGSTPSSFTDLVGAADTNDYYRFSLTGASNFQLTLGNLQADADVELLNSSGSLIRRSATSGTASESIVQSLAAGTYFIRVYPFNSANTSYQLTVSATGTTPSPNDPGNSLGTAESQSSPVFLRSQQVSSSDRDDFYRFNVSQSGIFTANLSGLSGDADVRLVRDANSNGSIDQNEVLAWQWERGSGSESIRRFLSAGTYFLQVNSYNRQTANYRLSTGFSAATSDSRRFSIQVNFGQNLGGLGTAARNAITQAARVWENLISFSSFSGTHNLSINIEGVFSNNNVLASAGPTTFTTDTNRRLMPVTGLSDINTRFNTTYNNNPGFLQSVMVHEIGHILGIGTIWESNERSLINRASSTYNANTYAGWAYGELRGTFQQTAVPIEPQVFGHWNEATFRRELMTPFAEAVGTPMPLSQLTVASLRDIGWNVNYGAAEPYTLPIAIASTSTSQLNDGNSLLQARCGCAAHLMNNGFHTVGGSRLAELIVA